MNMKLRYAIIFTKMSFMGSAWKFVAVHIGSENATVQMNGTTQYVWWYGPAENRGSNKKTLEYKVCCNQTVKFTQTGHVNQKYQGKNPPHVTLNHNGMYSTPAGRETLLHEIRKFVHFI